MPLPLPPALSNSKLLLTGSRFDVVGVERHGRDGSVHLKEVIVHPGAVVVLPMIDAHTIALIRNERVSVGQTLLELPAGTLEVGEDPTHCAGRELIEETGYQAARITPLNEFYSSPGICTEKMYAFVATGLVQVGQQLEATENIVVVPTPLTDCLTMIRENRISDGKTIAALLYYYMFGR